jgi:hypothetical protein
MWEVVKTKNGKESILYGPLSWGDAYSNYETEAAKWNAQNDKGEYLHPDVRVSIRKASEVAA